MRWLLTLCLFALSLSSSAQVDSTTPPYKKFPTLPPFQILLGDSLTKYSKENLPRDKPVLFMLFSPDCSHCQHEAEELVAHKEEIRDIQLVLITLHPLWQMNEFAGRYRLKEIENIIIGKDIYYLLPSFYAIHNLPFHAMYDKKGNLLDVFEGSVDLDKIVEAFRK